MDNEALIGTIMGTISGLVFLFIFIYLVKDLGNSNER